MTIHFENREKAVLDLIAHGYRELKSGNWVNRDRSFAASIHPTHNGKVVCVSYREVEA